MTGQAYKFRAFLSYSRQDDAAVARLHRRLEAYEIPKALRKGEARRLGRFFRDKDELGAAARLGDELEEKLGEAEWLIVCCSPAAAASRWVNAELDAFIARRGRDNILAVLLNGDPREAFPAVLQEREPVAADFRKTGDGEEMGFLKLVAGLLHVDVGELRDRQAAADRTRARNRAILTAVFALLALAASIAAVLAVQQSRRAEAMASEAIAIGAGVVGKADDLSRKFGVPTSAVEELLGFADERFERLFGEGVQTSELERQRAGLLVQFATLYGRVGDSPAQKEQAEKALAMFEQLPADQLRTVDYVKALAAAGDAHLDLGRSKEAIAYHARAIEAARAMLADIPEGLLARNHLAGALQRLGNVHMDAGRPGDALPLFAEAVGLLEDVLARSSADPLADTNLAAALDSLAGAQAATGDLPAAKATFARAITRCRTGLDARPDSLAARSILGTSLMKLGQALADAQDYEAARAAFAESVSSARVLVQSDPRDAELQRDLALRLVLASEVEGKLGNDAQADASMREGTDLARALVARDPKNLRNAAILADALAAHAYLLSRRGDAAAARDVRAEIVEVRRALFAAAPAQAVEPKANLAFAWEMLGDGSAAVRDLDGMLGAYGAAVPLRRELLAADPDSRDAKRNLAAVLHALGLTKTFASDREGALAGLGEATDLRLELAKAAPGDAEAAFSAVDSLQQLALVQAELDASATRKSLEGARDLLQALVSAHPDDPRYRSSLQKTEAVLATLATR